MKVNPNIQKIIAKRVLSEEEENKRKEPSGRLSASRLGWPLQWQMLHHFKVPQKEIDEYTLRKFQRGKDVEERVMKWLAPKPEDMQVDAQYRGVVGFIDVIMEYPIEVKSVTNMAFKYIQKSGPKFGHMMQGELYAKAKGFNKYGVAYVASDDYRVLCYELDVSGEVDKIIDDYEAQVKIGKVPLFDPREKWHSIQDYNPYAEWQKLDEKQIEEKLYNEYNVKTGGVTSLFY
ncbi:MAG TPA: hypothetical protein DCZ03_15130 [Gammaproteobacteria bacterium]|nr:hypothetical protein [Gammaproteobacteria bacterium]